MNSLSLLIYAVDLVSKLGSFAVVFTVLGAIGFVVIGFCRLVFYGDSNIDKDFRVQGAIFTKFWHRVATAILFIAIATQVFVPSRQTAIMIAASEVAEIVVKSEQAASVMKDVTGLGQDAVGLLKSYIQTEQKKLLEELKPAEDKSKEKENV